MSKNRVLFLWPNDSLYLHPMSHKNYSEYTCINHFVFSPGCVKDSTHLVKKSKHYAVYIKTPLCMIYFQSQRPWTLTKDPGLNTIWQTYWWPDFNYWADDYWTLSNMLPLFPRQRACDMTFDLQILICTDDFQIVDGEMFDPIKLILVKNQIMSFQKWWWYLKIFFKKLI